jgi:hypothetical protein
MRHDMKSCDQGGEDQDEAWLDGLVARVKASCVMAWRRRTKATVKSK